MAMRHTAAGRALPCALRALRAALRAHCGCISANAYRPLAKRAIRHARHTSRTIANGIANGTMQLTACKHAVGTLTARLCLRASSERKRIGFQLLEKTRTRILPPAASATPTPWTRTRARLDGTENIKSNNITLDPHPRACGRSNNYIIIIDLFVPAPARVWAKRSRSWTDSPGPPAPARVWAKRLGVVRIIIIR